MEGRYETDSEIPLMPYKTLEDRAKCAQRQRDTRGEIIRAKRRARWAAGYNRLSRYGVSPEQVMDLWAAQKFECPICCQPLLDPSKAHLDHDHKTGEIRGLLCGPCNRGIGYLKDSPGNCHRAATYLQKPILGV